MRSRFKGFWDFGLVVVGHFHLILLRVSVLIESSCSAMSRVPIYVDTPCRRAASRPQAPKQDRARKHIWRLRLTSHGSSSSPIARFLKRSNQWSLSFACRNPPTVLNPFSGTPGSELPDPSLWSRIQFIPLVGEQTSG